MTLRLGRPIPPLAVAVAVAVALGASGWPRTALAEPFAVEVPVMEAGQPRVILARRPGQVAAMQITFSAGAVEDGGRRGLTRLAQYALLAANRRLDYEALLLAVHASAGTLEVETRLRDCGFLLTADRRDFLPLARQLAAATLSPQLDRGRFPGAQARALLDARQRGHGQDLLSLVASLVVEDGRYRNEPFGDRDSVEALSAEDVAQHLAGPLSPANATVVVTGTFDRDEVLRLLRGFRGGQAVSVTRPSIGVPFRSRKLAAQETYIMAFPLRLATPRDAAAVRLGAALLDDELWRRFRQAGVGYSYSVEPIRSPWLDLLLVFLPAHDPSSLDLAPHLAETVARVRAGQLAPGQLERARGAARARLLEVDREAALLARALTEGGPGWHGKAVAAELEALDQPRLAAALAPLLAPEGSIFVAFGPRP